MELLAAYAPWQIAAALGAALGSAFVRGLTGFGMAILLVPILALALPPVESVLLANFLSLFIGLTEVRRLFRGAERSAWRVSLLSTQWKKARLANVKLKIHNTIIYVNVRVEHK